MVRLVFGIKRTKNVSRETFFQVLLAGKASKLRDENLKFPYSSMTTGRLMFHVKHWSGFFADGS